MSEAKKIIRRHRQPKRELVPDGEFRNVTVRLEASVYNRLAALANETQTSIGFVTECVLANRKIEAFAPKPKPAAERAASVEDAVRRFLATEGAPTEH